MGAIRDSDVKQLFLNAKPRSLEFGGSKNHFLLFFKLHHRFGISLFITK